MQGDCDATKGDATTSHQSEREANERQKAQADKRRRGDDEEGHVVLLSGGGGSAVPMGANGDTQGILRRLVRPTGDGDGRMRRGGDPTAFVVVAAPRVVVSAPVIVVVAHRPSPFPYVTKCLLPDRC